MARRDRGASGVALDDVGGGLALDTPDPGPLTGPHDGDDLDPEITEAQGCVDFGAIRVPVPARGKVTVEPTANGRMQAVHIALPEGRLSVSALAAPKSSKLWPELSREIDASLRDGGATVRSFPGDWGRELHATSGGATSVFVGVDGARWMLYGVATGPSTHAEALDEDLRRVLRGTVVVRGKSPYPVRTILPLVVPEHLAEAAAGAQAGEEAAGGKQARTQATRKSGAGKSGARKSGARKSEAQEPAAEEAAREAAQRKAVLEAARKKAARKKAAERKAAQERAAQERVVEERAAEERAARAEAARTAGTGAYPAASTIPTGPGHDAPLREQSPSARRAAAASWRSRPAVPDADGLPPAELDRLPAAGAARPDDSGPGGRRRLREPGTGAQPTVGGRRRLREPLDEGYGSAAAPEPVSGGRRRLRDEPPPEVPAADLDPGRAGRRRLREPDPLRRTAEVPEGRRLLGEPPVGEPPTTATGRRRLGAPDAAATGASGADRFREPEAADDVSGTGRRRLREPGAADVSGTGRRSLREPAADAGGVSGTGRRALREPGAADVSGTGRRHLREPDAGVADVSGTGRRHLREPGAGADVSGTGRRALREPGPDVAGVSGTGRRHLREPDPGVAEVPRTGRRHLQEPAEPSAADGTWEPVTPPAPPGGRRRRHEPDPLAVDVPTAAISGHGARTAAEALFPDRSEPLGHRPSDPTLASADAWVPVPAGQATARGDESEAARWDAVDPGPVPSWSVEPVGRGGPVEETAQSAPVAQPGEGRPWDGGAPADGSRPGGRRRRREPDERDEWATGLGGARRHEAADTGARPEPAPADPFGPRADPPPSGGRRHRRAAPEPAPGGAPAEPWLLESERPAPDGGWRRDPDRGGRRTLGSEYLIETGEQDPSWAAFLDRFTSEAQERPGGRHSTGGSEDAPPTERLRTLPDGVDPGRPGGRHHRES